MTRPPGQSSPADRRSSATTPSNYVSVDGRPAAVIDFDHAAPGDRLRDVAYAGWLWTISADDGPPLPEQARRLRLMVDAYGLPDPSVLLDALLRRQEENLAAALTRSRSLDPAVADYGRLSATWQRQQMAWLCEHADAFRAALVTGASRPAERVACSRSSSPARRAPARLWC